jgi:hypothetical protein
MRTHGYSWESDLWTPKICEEIVELFSGGREWDRDLFRDRLSEASARVLRLGRIEILCRIYGLNLIVPKSKSVGIKLDGKCRAIIFADEAKRIISAVKGELKGNRATAFYNEIAKMTHQFDCCNAVRGHLWEAICVTLIVAALKKANVEGALSINSIRNVALGLFKASPTNYLTQQAQKHYVSQHRRAGLQ